jgi:hypothetical protein
MWQENWFMQFTEFACFGVNVWKLIANMLKFSFEKGMCPLWALSSDNVLLREAG